MRIHFIAIGGAAMHNLALALHHKGHIVTGSDDEIFEPSRSRLQKVGLLPEETGWFANRINSEIDAVILGMHARKDNPELLKALELGLKIYSYPEFMYHETQNKTRAVIGGSHGKTTITSMIMHVLKYSEASFDYLVGSQIEGFDTMVGLEKDSVSAVIEGDEYLASPLQPVPKFHLYHPHIALISGIAWDHINVFPTFESYVEQFRLFIEKIEPQGKLIWYAGDAELSKIVNEHSRKDIECIPYDIPSHLIINSISYINYQDKQIPLQIFGDHNLINLEGARLVCNALGISDEKFFDAIQHFKGAAKRLEPIVLNQKQVVFRDFAHSPSKLKATVQAVMKQYHSMNIACVMELHTFSSLNKNFLNEYAQSMNDAEEAVVYFNPATIAHKKLESISVEDVIMAFKHPKLSVITGVEELKSYFEKLKKDQRSVLLMSSGNWGGIDIVDFFKE
jgi:UDP-N-acetylmuramate: L-alanyl-gamma-D-glutamyl-meso-diaminopimelate ligase